MCLREVGEGGGFGFEGGDGFDEAGDGKGVANAALSADEPEHATFAGELDGNAHEGGNAGAVDLGNAVEDNNHFAGARFDDGLESIVELVGRFANGQATVNFEHGNSGGFPNVDLHGQSVSHGYGSIHLPGAGTLVREAARHYTL